MTGLAIAVWLAMGTGRRSATPVDAPTPAEVERAKPRSADERVVSDAARRQALARARVWPRSRPSLEQESFRARHPRRGLVPLPRDAARRHDAEVRLRARERRDASRQVRQRVRDSVRGRRDAAGPRARFSGRHHHVGEAPALPRLPGGAIHHREDGRTPRTPAPCLRMRLTTASIAISTGWPSSASTTVSPSKPPRNRAGRFTNSTRWTRHKAEPRARTWTPYACWRRFCRIGTTSPRTSGWCARAGPGPRTRPARSRCWSSRTWGPPSALGRSISTAGARPASGGIARPAV